MSRLHRVGITRMMVPLITAIGTSVLLAVPAGAFTLAKAESTFSINNFSELPLDVTTFRDANTQAIAPGGVVKSSADADALFRVDLVNPANSQANGFASSIINGSGNQYFGLAESVAQIIGYRFPIASGTTFSFDFNSSLNLNTAVDQPGIETATAIGTLGLGLYDATDPNNLTLLDFFSIDGNLGTSDRNALTLDQSAGITFSDKQTTLDGFLGDPKATASASVKGKFSRTFTNATSLTLIEFALNKTTVAVPEPSNVLALVVVMGGLGIRFWRKPKPTNRLIVQSQPRNEAS